MLVDVEPEYLPRPRRVGGRDHGADARDRSGTPVWPDAPLYLHDRIGVNARLDAVQGVVLHAKLRRLEVRRKAPDRYAELADVPGVRVPAVCPGDEDVWHPYVVRVEESDRVVMALSSVDIGVGIYYPTPMHLASTYELLGCGRGRFRVAEAPSDRMLSLPMFPHLTGDRQGRACDAFVNETSS